MGAAVGIDLGTTKCVVAAAAPGGIGWVLRNKFGEFETPAIVAEDSSGEIVFGRQAEYRIQQGAIVSAKRSLGHDKIFALPHHGAVRPQDAVSFLLEDLKSTAERELGDVVDIHGNVWEWCHELDSTPERPCVVSGSNDGTVKVWSRAPDSSSSISGSPLVPSETVDFASYASEDRDQVLGRLQGMQKRTPSLEVFLDVVALRSGQNWEEELYREISHSDVFYLFWSNHARDSEWVRREWHCALERRGLAFIDPVPLVDPKDVPPPPELASKHFNDWVLAFLRRQ